MKEKNVCVLMSTYNGERYIRQQIDSILNQEGVNVTLLVRDDGSSDNTLDILEEYNALENFSYILENNIGVGESFWRLLSLANKYDYYAWADQDDLWDQDKLAIAVSYLLKEDEERPLLYFSESRSVNENLEVEYKQKRVYRRRTLANALILNNAQGSTMVFNYKLFLESKKYTPDFKRLCIYHDGWMMRLCLALNGRVLYDATPHMSYRIHENNVVALNPKKKDSTRKKIINALTIRDPYFSSTIAKSLLEGYSDDIKSDEKMIVESVAYCNESIKIRFHVLFSKEYKSGVLLRDFRLILRIIRRIL